MLQDFEAFIFDLDGTLVDSTGIVDRVMDAWCKQNGVSFSDLQEANHGARSVDTIAAVAPHLDPVVEADKIEAMEREASRHLQEIPGASDFVHRLPLERWGIATSSHSITAVEKLNAAKVPIAEVLIAAEDVSEGKPHPEAYLAASERLDVDPRRCLVFEDSEAGTQSALSAGCQVLLVGNRCRASDPSIIGRVDDFTELEAIALANASLRIRIKP